MDGEEHVPITLNDLDSVMLTPQGAGHSIASSMPAIQARTSTPNTDNPLIKLANPSNQLITGMDGEEHVPITLNDLDSVMLTPQGAGHSVASSLPAIQAPTSTPVYHIPSTFNQTGWDQAISQRVVWMANQQLQSASLTINPEHLGPIQIQVQIDNQQLANVQFIALQPEVRAALQNAIPLLSDMLEQSGIQLGQSDVSSQHPKSQSGKQEQNNSPWTSNDQSSLSINSTELNSDQLVTGGHNLINVYA
jgi:flagellar hook-length control protein FliK